MSLWACARVSRTSSQRLQQRDRGGPDETVAGLDSPAVDKDTL